MEYRLHGVRRAGAIWMCLEFDDLPILKSVRSPYLGAERHVSVQIVVHVEACIVGVRIEHGRVGRWRGRHALDLSHGDQDAGQNELLLRDAGRFCVDDLQIARF